MNLGKHEVNNERGTALTELVVALLFLIPLLFGLLDFSIMISNYQKLEQAVREGLRTSTRLRSMTPGFCFTDHDLAQTGNLTNAQFCENNPGNQNNTGLDCEHSFVHARARRVVSHQRLTNFRSEPAEINGFEASANFSTVFCQPDSTTSSIPCANNTVDCTGFSSDSIAVFVSGRYEGFFGNWPLSASYRGPWLYQNTGA